MQTPQCVSLKELVANYIRQDYFRTKFMLFLVGLGNEDAATVASLLDFKTNFLVGNVGALTAIQMDSLEELKLRSKSLLDHNAKTVNTKQDGIKFLSFALGVEIGSDKYLDEGVKEEFLATGKSPVYIEIQRTATKIPVLGVGGGSMANLLSCRYVLNSKKHLKRALFVHRSGDLCNSKNQALVPILENDFVVEVRGTKPLSMLNPDLEIHIYKVVTIHETKLECEDVTVEKLSESYFPKSVIEGAHIYHNREGSYFCSTDTKTKKKLTVR